jgi:transcriptional regulator with XRE-family HTH domain
MAHLTPEQNEKLREAMQRAISERFGSRTQLAEAMGRSQPSLSDFLNKTSGASMETAELFAQRIAKRPVDEIIGGRKVAAVTKSVTKRPTGYQVDAETRRKAIVLLKQPPQNFSDAAIEIAEEATVFETAEEARNPVAVAEAWRLAILGTAASLPRPSGVPPAGTRRSRRRA